MSLSKLKTKISKLPQNPGVYFFRDKKEHILYIGKATNLRARVNSYFSLSQNPTPTLPLVRGEGFGRPIEVMIHQVADIKTIETESVLEALILESNLIKKYQPKYNVKEKDDKSFVHAAITKEKFPRIVILRKTDLENKYVIPSLSRNPIRKKQEDPSTPLRSVRDDIKIRQIFGPYTSKKQLEIALKIIRKIFPYHSNSQKTEKGCLDFQLGRCPGPYAGAITREDYLKNIRGIKMILEGKKKGLVKKMEKEMKEDARKNEFEKAAEIRNKIFALKHIQDVALISSEGSTLALAKVEPLRDLRIEGYDISNISGQYAVGSMVVFKNNEPDKSQYRKFKIKTIQGADDVGMMREVLLRRFRRTPPQPSPWKGEEDFWPQPDLIFLDGGKGHLNMSENLLKELGLSIPMVAVAKGPTRKISNFQFIISNQIPMSEIPKEILDIMNNKNLIGQIMSEAHRFAIGYHKKLRRKSLIS